MEFVDTHSHLYLSHFSDDIDDAVKRALNCGVKNILLPNVDLETAEPLLNLSSKFPGICHPMMALHPTSVKENYKDVLEDIRQLLFSGQYIAVGETGIDLYWDKTYYKEQIYCFEKHIEWAIAMDLPLVIHSRKSLEPIIEILKNYRNEKLKGVFHCYPGNVIQSEKVLELGFYLGIGGVVTYKNSEMSRVVKEISLEHMLLETDAPYLPPVPYRGQRNESAYIRVIAEKITEIKEVAIEEVAKITTNNAKVLFNL